MLRLSVYNICKTVHASVYNIANGMYTLRLRLIMILCIRSDFFIFKVQHRLKCRVWLRIVLCVHVPNCLKCRDNLDKIESKPKFTQKR